MKTIIIVAMTRDRIIGRDGQVPWHDRDDLKFFRRTTTGHAVVMGRKTFESIGKPLSDRRNVVMTRQRDYVAPPGVDVVHSLAEAMALCRRREESQAFIIGGGQVYELALPTADEMIITHFEADGISGDTHFPEWSEHEWVSEGVVDHAFPRAIRYRRRGHSRRT